MAYDFDLFVIGGGSGGVRCARISAGYGARVGIAEARFWGGTCVNVGCVPKKLLVQAGEYAGWAEDAAGFGWDMQKGPHDWAKMIAAKDAVVARLNGIYSTLLTKAGVTSFDARATFIDAHTLDVGGKRITAEHILIATGGHAVRPGIPGADLGILSDDAFALPEMPHRIVIVGGGYIALEFAGIFSALGAKVDLVYRQPLPLRGFDPDLREQVAAGMEAAGVTLHPMCSPQSVRAAGDGTRVMTLTNGHTLETDLVFFATGRKPATESLGLEAAGVATTLTGAVVVDDHLRTSMPTIYAVGDVTDRMNLTPVATAEGHALADTLYGGNPRTVSLDNIATAIFTTPPAATVGLTEDEAALRGPADIYVTHFTPLRHVLTARTRRTMMKLVVDQRTQKVLGAHMVGDDAAEIMQGIAIAIQCGATKADFDRTIGVHPTAAEEFVTLRTRTRVAGIAQAAE